jgi:putative endonuclease
LRKRATWQSQVSSTLMSNQYYVYIMTNKGNKVLYTGVTRDLKKRIYEHKEKLVEGFTKRYNLTKLVYFEIYSDIESAISREKQIKDGSRQKKIDLINSINNKWRDLYNDL